MEGKLGINLYVVHSVVQGRQAWKKLGSWESI